MRITFDTKPRAIAPGGRPHVRVFVGDESKPVGALLRDDDGSWYPDGALESVYGEWPADERCDLNRAEGLILDAIELEGRRRGCVMISSAASELHDLRIRLDALEVLAPNVDLYRDKITHPLQEIIASLIEAVDHVEEPNI